MVTRDMAIKGMEEIKDTEETRMEIRATEEIHMVTRDMAIKGTEDTTKVDITKDILHLHLLL